MSNPPGISHPISNALIVAKRKLLNLEDPVRLLFDQPWIKGNELFDWYERRQGDHRFIHTIQLRKERESPFFHEYIALRLKGQTPDYFRIDRRQRRDESRPMSSIYNEGVEAYDTIDNISSLEDRCYGASDCLINITFKESTEVHLLLLLKICRAIAQHQSSRVYTLQRYNCYFYAQTIMLCTVCAVSDWDGTQSVTEEVEISARGWKTPNLTNSDVFQEPVSESTITKNPRGAVNSDRLPSSRLNYSWDRLSQLAKDVVNAHPFLLHADGCTQCRQSQSPHRAPSVSNKIDNVKVLLSSHWDTVYRTYVDRVYSESYRDIVCSGIWELEVKDKSKEMCTQLITEESSRTKIQWEKYQEEILASLATISRSLLNPTEVCSAWVPEHDVWSSICASDSGTQLRRAVRRWNDETTACIVSAYPGLRRSLYVQAGDACSKAHKLAIDARMDSFQNRMIIQTVEIISAAVDYDQQDLIKLAVIPDGRPAPIHRRIREAFTGRPKGPKYGAMQEVKIKDLLGFVDRLIFAHSVRVEQHRAWLKCSAEDVKKDICTVMNDIWSAATGTN